MIDETAQVMRIAMAQSIATDIIKLATIDANPSEIESHFEQHGGSITTTNDAVTAELFGIKQTHSERPFLAIYLWAEVALDLASGMEIKDALELFLMLHGTAKLDDLTATIRALCSQGMGNFLAPQNHANQSATHMFEIEFLGVNTSGFGEFEATRNWQKAATAILSTQAAA